MKTPIFTNVGAVWLCILVTAAIFTALGHFKTLAGDTAEVTFYVH